MASDLAASLLDDVLGFDDILRKAIDKAFAIAREEEARKAEERRAEEMRELDEFMTQLKDESLRLANAVQDYQSTTSALVAQLSSANKEIEDLKKSLARQAAEAERAKTDIAAMKLLIETEIVGRCSAEADRVRLRDHLNSRLAFRGLVIEPIKQYHPSPTEQISFEHLLNSSGAVTTGVITHHSHNISSSISDLPSPPSSNSPSPSSRPSVTTTVSPLTYHQRALAAAASRSSLSSISRLEKVRCLQCKKLQNRMNMRRHVGMHILRNREGGIDPDVVKSITSEFPCGTCGEDCDIFLCENRSPALHQTCPLQYKFSLAPVSKFTAPNPCTNIPVICPLCPCIEGAQRAVWKYNLPAHIKKKHAEIDESDLPLSLRSLMQIGREEMQALGVVVKRVDDPESEDETELL